MTQSEKPDLGADYKSAGFGGSLAFGARPALVIVDFVRAYIEPGSPLYAGCESAFESAKRVLAGARAARIPIIFTGVEYEPGGINGGVFFRKVGSLAARSIRKSSRARSRMTRCSCSKTPITTVARTKPPSSPMG